MQPIQAGVTFPQEEIPSPNEDGNTRDCGHFLCDASVDAAKHRGPQVLEESVRASVQQPIIVLEARPSVLPACFNVGVANIEQRVVL